MIIYGIGFLLTWIYIGYIAINVYESQDLNWANSILYWIGCFILAGVTSALWPLFWTYVLIKAIVTALVHD